MKRRGFIKKLSLYLASVAGLIAVVSLLRQLVPKRIGKSRRIKVGNISDFPVDTYTLIENHKLFVYRDHESMKAVSSICTHLGCTVQHLSDGFECPCHGSFYSEDGTVLSGPAPRSLSWYVMERLPDGSIIVDKDRISGADEKYFLV